MANKKTEMQSGDRVNPVVSPMPNEAGGSADDRSNRIAAAAFLRAASRNFVGGDPVEDWLQAEIEIDAGLKTRQRSQQ
jgi:Protein of unknown function (DUF2934)